MQLFTHLYQLKLIPPTGNYNNLDYRYMNTREGTYGSNDMRGISLSLSYSLFNQDLKVKGSRNDQEVINRTM